MSHTRYEPARPRLQRSELAVPGSQPQLFAQGARQRGGLRLPRSRGRRRAGATRSRPGSNVIAALLEHDWRAARQDDLRADQRDRHPLHVPRRGGRRRAGRPPAGHGARSPRSGVPADVYLVDALLTQIEEAQGHRAPDRDRGADRDRARHGQRRGDRAVEPAARGDALRRRRLRGELPRAHGEHRRAQPRLSGRPVALRALAHDRRLPGLRTPRRSTARSATSRIPTGYRAAARRGAALGIEGKWAIHPSPDRAGQRGVHAAAGRGRARPADPASRSTRRPREGRGAAQLDGRMIDAASARMAQNVVSMAEAMAARR